MCFIYLIKAEESSRYKIGISKNPQNRLRQLQTGNSEKLDIIHIFESAIAKKVESALHNTYGSLRKSGEWFELSLKEEVEFINKCKDIENNMLFLIENGNKFI